MNTGMEETLQHRILRGEAVASNPSRHGPQPENRGGHEPVEGLVISVLRPLDQDPIHRTF